MWTTVCLSLAMLGLPAPEVEQDPAPPNAPTLSVSGQVQDEEGNPLSAVVVLRVNAGGYLYVMGQPHGRDVLGAQTTGADGRFRFDRVPIPLRLQHLVLGKRLQGGVGAGLVIWAEGYGLKWLDLDLAAPPQDRRILLQKQADLSGEITNGDGQPIAGAVIQLRAATPATDELDRFYYGPGRLNLNLSQVEISTTTDAKGKFQVPHAPPGYRVVLYVERQGFISQSFLVNLSPELDLYEMTYPDSSQPPTKVFAPPLKLQLERAREITLVITDADGQPVTRGGVLLIDSERHGAGQGRPDVDGKVRIAVTKNGTFTAFYYSDIYQPTMNGQVEIVVEDQGLPEPVYLQLAKGEQLEGRFVNGDTDEPVPGAMVGFSQIEGEGRSAKLLASSHAVSGADGSFRLPVVAGKGNLKLAGLISGYHLPSESLPIEVTAGESPKPVTLKLSRGRGIRGRVLDEAGQGVSGVLVSAQEQGGYRFTASTISGEEGRYEMSGISPKESLLVFAMNQPGAATSLVEPEETDPSGITVWSQVDLRLKRGVVLQGRVLKNGQPRADLDVRLSRSFGDAAKRLHTETTVKTDTEGKYQFAGLEPGDLYSLAMEDGDDRPSPNWPHQKPYVKRVTEGPVMELPDVNLMPFGQTLAGIVVSPSGEPLPGISVSAWTGSRSLSRPDNGPPPWTKTDSRGRFRLKQLPDEPLQLMAHVANPQGGPIRFPAKVDCERNQTDIRIVIDPRLTTEVEDLDAPKK